MTTEVPATAGGHRRELPPRRRSDRLETKQRASLESVLLRLPALLADLDVRRIRAGITEATREVTGATFAMYVAVDEDTESATVAGTEDVVLGGLPDVRRAPLLAAAFGGSEPLRIDDVARWASSEATAEPYGSLADGRVVRSYVAAPVATRRGELLGALFVGHQRANAFDARDERLVAGMSSHLAVALENARALDERTRVAQALQETLLPPLLPDIDGVDLAARYHPAGEGNVVGGDFYDVFQDASGDWGVVLGDVSGVGPEAAGVTGLARYTIRAIATREARPSAVLGALNDAINAQRYGERFCTAVYLAFSPAGPESGAGARGVLANAGHPPPLLLRDDGTVTVLDEHTGLLLGQFAEAGLRDVPVELRPGDALVLYTDGVVEARAPGGQEFGQDRLVELVATCAGRTAGGIARRIELSVIDYQVGNMLDDLAVVVVRAEL